MIKELYWKEVDACLFLLQCPLESFNIRSWLNISLKNIVSLVCPTTVCSFKIRFLFKRHLIFLQFFRHNRKILGSGLFSTDEKLKMPGLSMTLLLINQKSYVHKWCMESSNRLYIWFYLFKVLSTHFRLAYITPIHCSWFQYQATIRQDCWCCQLVPTFTGRCGKNYRLYGYSKFIPLNKTDCRWLALCAMEYYHYEYLNITHVLDFQKRDFS